MERNHIDVTFLFLMNLTEKIQRYYELYTTLMPKFMVALAFKVTKYCHRAKNVIQTLLPRFLLSM